MRPLISIIVPVYNSEQSLRQCIESILMQSLASFELLLIDDGSKDKSGRICEEYAKKDKRIRVFHKENGGVSSARNIGLKQMNGEYVCFIDSDDIIEQEYLNIISNYSNETKLIITGYKTFGAKKGIKTYKKEKVSLRNIAQQKVFNQEYTQILFYCPWGKFFKSQIIKENRIFFDTGLILGEDTCFIMQYIQHISTIELDDSCLYLYNMPNEASTKYLMNNETFTQHIKRFDSYYKELNKHFPDTFYGIKRAMYGVYWGKFIVNLSFLKYQALKIDLALAKPTLENVLNVIFQKRNAKTILYSHIIHHPFICFPILNLIRILKGRL